MRKILTLTLTIFGTQILWAQTPAPKGAIILFDGKDASKWCHRGNRGECKWVIKDGYMEVNPGTSDIITKEEFGDFRLHVEFWLPSMTEEGQGRGNSGVYSHGRYEIQVLDSFKNPTYPFGGCGAIYEQKDPDVNAILPPETWNTYDITFRAPRFNKAGEVVEKPRITVFHNGLRIHNNVLIEKSSTRSGQDGPQPKRGPILLQNHGNPIRFRNIWIVPIKG